MTTKSWKNHPQKLLRKIQILFFFLTAWAAKTAQTEEFIFQNVAYRPTVYRTGIWVNSKSQKSTFQKWKLPLIKRYMLKCNNQTMYLKVTQLKTSQPSWHYSVRSPAHYESCGAIQSITCVLQVDLISRSKELSWFLGIAKFNFALNRKPGIIVPAVPTYLPTLILTAGQKSVVIFWLHIGGFSLW